MTDHPDPLILQELPTQSGHKIAVAKLCAPRALNALSLEMIRPLDQKLRAWGNDPEVVAVVLMGEGEKAFCAGGDVRRLRRAILENSEVPNPFVVTYFSEEYCLDFLIHTYKKPLIVWGTGIVMGGGLGLMAGARHKIVTETTKIAMPEITIGLYPDVGGSWFLNRLIGRLGLFLALTAAPLNASDALKLGLGDYFFSSRQRAHVLDILQTLAWTSNIEHNHHLLSHALNTASMHTQYEFLAPMPSMVWQHFDLIQETMRGEDFWAVTEAILALEHHADAWLREAGRRLREGSPTSAALSWEIFRRAKHLSLAEVFRMELVLSARCAAHVDFVEGVRALLVDKDQSPHWSPATLSAVSFEAIEPFFASFWTPWAHPLAGLGMSDWTE